VFDPDQQVQRGVRLLFETFRQTGSALRVVHHFKTEGVLWPRRITAGVRAGELLFGPLEHSRVLAFCTIRATREHSSMGELASARLSLGDSFATDA
jgi:hypothetical protein